MHSKTITRRKEKVAVVLMTYGSPATLDDIPAYLKNIYGGREPDPDIIIEFRRRYNLIGGSPLLAITQEQAQALEVELNSHSRSAYDYKVTAGMRFAPPFIKDVVPNIGKDTTKLVGLIMSPQYSPIIMGGYEKALKESIEISNRNDIRVILANDWHLQPFFIQALTIRITEALDRFSADIRAEVQILFTAHSMPKRVIDKDPEYIRKLQDTAKVLAKEVDITNTRWLFCYQSAGHSPEKWLKPDFADIIPQIKATGHTNVLVVSLQFIADHLEVLYDIDIAARKQAEDYGINFVRTESLNASPIFIKALAVEVQKVILNEDF